MKLTVNSTPIYLSLLKLVAFTSVVIATSSCVDDTHSTNPAQQSDPDLSEPSTPDPTPQVGVSPPERPLSGPPQTDSATSRYPLDTEKNDRPGLIISGINAQAIQNLESPFLLSASAFRLERQTSGSGDGYVHMVVYEDAMPVSAHIEFYQPPIGSCLLRDLEANDSAVSEGVDTSVSGGSGVVVNSPSGPWFTFDRQRRESSQFLYQVDNELPGRFPVEATLSVPGDEFPTVSAHPVFEPEAPVRLLPTRGQAVTSDSEFSWMAGPDSGYVKINLLAYDDSNEFLGFAVTCWGEDDGHFEMPATVMDYVERSELTLTARYSRVYARLDWVNGMVIHQDIEVAE
jgi:hypothetical protein